MRFNKMFDLAKAYILRYLVPILIELGTVFTREVIIVIELAVREYQQTGDLTRAELAVLVKNRLKVIKDIDLENPIVDKFVDFLIEVILAKMEK